MAEFTISYQSFSQRDTCYLFRFCLWRIARTAYPCMKRTVPSAIIYISVRFEQIEGCLGFFCRPYCLLFSHYFDLSEHYRDSATSSSGWISQSFYKWKYSMGKKRSIKKGMGMCTLIYTPRNCISFSHFFPTFL